MASNKARSCYIFGGDTLLLECVEILLDRNVDVRGIISRNSRIKEWADKSKVPFIDLDSNYLPALSKTPFDYLFAITHPEIIPDAVLQLPQVLSVNFHDGPLPLYAGLNTPAWALMNNEDKYGITWHKITPGVDEGDILLQEIIEVAEIGRASCRERV